MVVAAPSSRVATVLALANRYETACLGSGCASGAVEGRGGAAAVAAGGGGKETTGRSIANDMGRRCCFCFCVFVREGGVRARATTPAMCGQRKTATW
mmetsp:Transcript_52728/g.146393  ORF Transcript_52728/g.146393 Transcript_52728/m.146393 type:complete len:97 (-) Transcript_52728:89-379(-)